MKINTNKNCDIVINTEPAYEDSVSIIIVLANKSNGNEIIYNRITGEEQIKIEKPNYADFFTVCQIILPKRKADGDTLDDNPYVLYEDYIRNEQINLLFGKYVPPVQEELQLEELPPLENVEYFTDGVYFYKMNTSRIVTRVSLLEIIEVNPESCNITKEIKNFFSVCQLRKCYVALCLKIFNDRAFDRCFNGKVDSELIYRRDLVWSALNVIQYMIDSNLLAEAQRLIERISGCNGLCAGVYRDDNDCGCN